MKFITCFLEHNQIKSKLTSSGQLFFSFSRECRGGPLFSRGFGWDGTPADVGGQLMTTTDSGCGGVGGVAAPHTLRPSQMEISAFRWQVASDSAATRTPHHRSSLLPGHMTMVSCAGGCGLLWWPLEHAGCCVYRWRMGAAVVTAGG